MFVIPVSSERSVFGLHDQILRLSDPEQNILRHKHGSKVFFACAIAGC